MKEENFNMDYVFGKEHRKAYMGLAMIWIIGYYFYLVHSDFINHYLFPIKFLFRNGYVGVDIFFILSAFGLCYSWERSSVTCFYKKRFIRIIPLYLVFLVLCKFLINADFSYEFHTGLQCSHSCFNSAHLYSGHSIAVTWF